MYENHKIQFKLIENERDIENKDTVIIVDSSIEKKNDLYVKLKLACSKVFLIHLGDETGIYDLSSIYNNCDFVWKAFCTNR